MDKNSFNGILLIFKERGYTSNDVVALLRKLLNMKKIGHTGTLDPEAVGLLPVCLGRGTKLVSLLTDTDKEYECVMRLGVTTDTEDMTGRILTEGPLPEGLDGNRVREAVTSFKGAYEQIPPMYSAKKIDGRKLYEYAREGREIERKPSKVAINYIDITEVELPLVSFTVECSKGTYIRSLCRDIGEALGCGAAMESLKRTRAGGFDLRDAFTIDEVRELKEEGRLKEHIITIESFFGDCPEFVSEDEVTDKAVRNGNPLRIRGVGDGRCRVYLSDKTFAALYEVKNSEARICGYFLT